MKKLRLILGDQLSLSIPTLSEIDKNNDIVFMCEVMGEATYVKHHKKKIAFLFSAMRHFAQSLVNLDIHVRYTKIDDEKNSGSFTSEVKRAIEETGCEALIVTFPGEYRVLSEMQTWGAQFGVPVSILEDSRFLITPSEFKLWASGKQKLLMEYFYRMMRQKHLILMRDGQPIGDKWNFDAENRKFPPKGTQFPSAFKIEPDATSLEVIKLVEQKFTDHFGSLADFHFAVTREQALQVLDDFIAHRLISFGDYQDAMIENEPWMFHSHISFYLNCGLLLPLECIKAAEAAYHHGSVPLSAVEGFIRQILGWREYVRGIYWLKMPSYAELNFLEADKDLPQFYWTANTKMNCLKQCVKETQQNAYAHHIQRLMVLGNFALLAGIDPKYVNEWFLIVYADAYEWVELPNVSGMILYADGGLLGSKPYASGGSYINKMSNYCKNCAYNVKEKVGDNACPFNYLYWGFLIRNESKLRGNMRLSMMYSTLDKMSIDAKTDIIASTSKLLNNINNI